MKVSVTKKSSIQLINSIKLLFCQINKINKIVKVYVNLSIAKICLNLVENRQ
jgi:hypothetical protein